MGLGLGFRLGSGLGLGLGLGLVLVLGVGLESVYAPGMARKRQVCAEVEAPGGPGPAAGAHAPGLKARAALLTW